MTTDTDKPGCLTALLRGLGLARAPEPERLPYLLRDDFLSPAELSLFHVLRTAAADWAVICPKVSLADLFYAKTGDYAQNRAYMNRIDRKHVDFVLCDPSTMQPVLGLELDDASHSRQDREKRDRFVEEVFAAAGLPLVRLPVRAQYNPRDLGEHLQSKLRRPGTPATAAAQEGAPVPAPTPAEAASPVAPPPCPKCGTPMVVRVSQREGPHKGKRFWGCANFPRCGGMRKIDD